MNISCVNFQIREHGGLSKGPAVPQHGFLYLPHSAGSGFGPHRRHPGVCMDGTFPEWVCMAGGP